MTHPSRVIVIGGGIAGICSALTLAERGVAVTLLDRDPLGTGAWVGASMGNAGVISPLGILPNASVGLWKHVPGWLMDREGPVSVRAGYLPRFIPWGIRFLLQGREDVIRRTSAAMDALNHDTIDLFRQHLQGTGHEGLIQDSCYVYAYRDARKARLDTLDTRLRRAAGGRIDRLDADELRALEPALSPDYTAAIVQQGQARALSPGRVCAVLLEKFLALGGTTEQREVTALQREGEGWRLETRSGPLTAPRIVLCAGAWSARLLAPLGLKLPLEAERGYHVVFRNPGVTLNNSVMDMDMKFVASSMETGLRAAGTAEFSGLDTPPNPRRIAALVKKAQRICPGMNSSEVQTWSGLRPSFYDSLPVIGELPGLPGLIGAFGHSHWGFMMGPKTGRIVADLVTGKTPNIDLTPYRANRF